MPASITNAYLKFNPVPDLRKTGPHGRIHCTHPPRILHPVKAKTDMTYANGWHSKNLGTGDMVLCADEDGSGTAKLFVRNPSNDGWDIFTFAAM